MKTQQKTHYLKDYKPHPYRIIHCKLQFILDREECHLNSTLNIQRQTEQEAPLALNAKDLKIKGIKLNGSPVTSSQYQQDEDFIVIEKVPQEFSLEFEITLNPRKNLSLEGLYASNQQLFTQCEPQGFRKICPYIDRPDNLATFEVTIEADPKLYPVILANGNLKEKGKKENGNHFTVWHDPYPKPSYLFAMVAGNFASLKSEHVSKKGKRTVIELFTSPEEIDQCKYALESLAAAMTWDEERFGLECDLDHYKIVAARDFNFGAMENKGLNIFNTALTYADPRYSRDVDFQQVYSVIGHEYFHNWTGNRVTCRDWFQLCLKEGLTVYRDQEFSADGFSAADQRIMDISFLRRYQWPEDDGPLSHPPRPSSYLEINNFYTATVYNKGAEIVRMIARSIGREKFRQGLELYFKKFDGQAVTQEDFVAVMGEAAGQDLSAYMRWYTTAGTPEVRITQKFENETYSLILEKDANDPRPICAGIALYDAQGKKIPLYLDGESQDHGKLEVLVECHESRELIFRQVSEQPTPSLMRDFSSPVKLKTDLISSDYAKLAQWDDDPFNVWEAFQNLFKESLSSELSEELKQVFTHALKQGTDPAFTALCLSMPTENEIAMEQKQIDVEAIHKSRKELKKILAQINEDLLMEKFASLRNKGQDIFSNENMARRSLKNTCLDYLYSLGQERYQNIVLEQFRTCDNLTDKESALRLMVWNKHPLHKECLEDFYNLYKNQELVIDRWFGIQASSPMQDPRAEMESLCQHPAFNKDNPNRLRALIRTFIAANPISFHHISGYGYQLCANFIIELDQTNPQMAAQLCKSFTHWRRYDSKRQELMRNEIMRISGKDLSLDVSEIVSKIIKV